MADGTVVRAADITLPAGSTLVSDPEHIVVTISVPSAEPAETGEVETPADEAGADNEA
jgi:large subunit ribosomal protein L25